MIEEKLAGIESYDEIRIRPNKKGYSLVFKGEYSQVVDLTESDVVDLYKWLGRNLGPFGEDWKSIVDSNTNWPENMSREDLYELAEIQQEIIKNIDNTMDEEAKDILRDIRDSLQNIEDSVADQTITVDTGSFTATSPAGPVTVSSNVAAEKITEAAKEVADDYAEEAGEAVDNYYDEIGDEEFAEDVLFPNSDGQLQKAKVNWFDRITSDYDINTEERQRLIDRLREAESPMEVGHVASDFLEDVDDTTFEEAINQIQS